MRHSRTDPWTTNITETANNGSPATSVANETNNSTSLEAQMLPLASRTTSDSADKNSNTAASEMIAVIGLTERLMERTLA
jgi:hypothetical protein